MPETPQPAKPMSEEVAVRKLHQSFDEVERFQQRLEDEKIRVQPGSAFAGDNRKTTPFELSHSAISVIWAATEHLRAVRSLIADAGILYPSVPFTLIRTAIEASALALWLVAPARRDERILRRMCLEYANIHDGERATTEMGLTANKPVHERVKRVTKLARAATGDPDLRLSKPAMTNILMHADSLPAARFSMLSTWRVCAGFAHARLWTALSVLQRDELPGDGPHMVEIRTTSTYVSVLWAYTAAWDATQHALTLYRTRAQRLY